ncbi:MAG: hypothetical protein JSS49_04650 [Planctomycetes bacterium]|nr:hypothetical protein [Planctomycetota bacterium]
MFDMRGNLAAGIFVALAGSALVRSMKSPSSTVVRRLWLPAIAFISGPLLTVGSCVVDVYCISKYTHPDDVVPMIVSAAVIGFVAGGIGAMAFWIVER